MTQHQLINRNCNRVMEVLTQGMDPAQKTEVLSGVFVAGGSLLHSDEPPRDYDVFCKTVEAWRALSVRLNRGSHSWQRVARGAEVRIDSKNPRLSGVFLPPFKATRRSRTGLFDPKAFIKDVSMVTQNSVSLASRIQIVTRFIGPVEDVFTTFDFEHCKVAWEPSLVSPTGGHLTYHGQSARAIAEKTLVYEPNSRFVFSAMKRMEKFVKRGYSIPVSTILNLKRSLDQLDLEDPEVLEEELSNYYGVNEELAARIRQACTNTSGRIDIDRFAEIAKEL